MAVGRRSRGIVLFPAGITFLVTRSWQSGCLL